MSHVKSSQPSRRLMTRICLIKPPTAFSVVPRSNQLLPIQQPYSIVNPLHKAIFHLDFLFLPLHLPFFSFLLIPSTLFKSRLFSIQNNQLHQHRHRPVLPLIITTISPPARANPLQPRFTSLTWHYKPRHSAAWQTHWCNPSTHMCI